MTGLRALDERRAAAVEALCELIVPGSSRVGPAVYVDALIAGMPPPVRDGALASIDALAPAAEQGSEALAEKAGIDISDDEIKRMVTDAESHAEDDRRLRELAEARNNGENAAYQAERQLKDLGEQVDASSKDEIEAAIKEVRESLTSDDAAAINAKTETLQSAFHKVSEAMYQRAQASASQPADAPDGASSNGSGDDEVVDAEVVDEQR